MGRYGYCNLLSLADKWSSIIRLGRIDSEKNKGLLDKLPFNIVAFPSIITYAPTGDIDLLSMSCSYHPQELNSTLKELLEMAVEKVPAETASRFLELGQFDSDANIKFNVLLLPKRKKLPLVYLRNAMNNLKVVTFGAVNSDHREKALKQLKVDTRYNLVLAYKSYNSTGKQIQGLKAYDASVAQMDTVITLAVRHSMVEIYRNNYHHYCVDYEFQSRGEEGEPSRTVCVLALLSDVPEEVEKLKGFQKFVVREFERKSANVTGKKEEEGVENVETKVQYGMVKLGWHPELKEFITETQKKFKMDKELLNYLIISPDTNTYTLTAPKNCRHS